MVRKNAATEKRGFAMVTMTIIIAVVLGFALALSSAILSSRRTGQIFQSSIDATQIADAGIQKAIFCLNAANGSKCGGTFGTNYVGENNVSFGDGTFSSTVTGTGPTRTITVTATTATGLVEKVATDLTTVPATDSPGFSYALQSGAGGAYLENNSTIHGSIYSNGDLLCQQTNARVTGDGYVAKSGGIIDHCSITYQAHADNITYSDVGDAYYKTGIGHTTVNGTRYPDSPTPPPADLPSVDLDFWHESALAGNPIDGDYSPANGSTLGPVKINGNLIMNNNVHVTIKGPVWVTGNITTGTGCAFNLDPAFGAHSTTILADDPSNHVDHGRITIINGTSVSGSGDPKSYILFVSTNSSIDDANPALRVANNSAGAVFLAENGVLKLDNRAGATSLAGYRLYLSQNSVVTYSESDFTGQFSNSPGLTWHQQAGTWREIR